MSIWVHTPVCTQTCTLYVHGSLISSRFVPIICWLINLCCIIVECPGELRKCTVVSTINRVISISCESSPLDIFGPADHYIIDVNGTIFNHSTDSTEIDIPVNCSSTYTIYITPVNRCRLEGTRVYVDTVNTGI